MSQDDRNLKVQSTLNLGTICKIALLRFNLKYFPKYWKNQNYFQV